MSRWKPNAKHILAWGLTVPGIIASAFILQLAWIPGQQSLGNDSGFFAYVGRQILAGQQLYVDIFDTKTPGIYYINALGLEVFGDTLWSVWLMGALRITAAALCLFLILRTRVNTGAAFTAVLVFLFTLHYPDYYQSGNLTEIFALLPQVLAIGAISTYLQTGKSRWLFAMGIATSLAVLFKPTYFGVGLGGTFIVLASDLSVRAWRSALRHALVVLSGLLLPLAIVALIAWTDDCLESLWEAVIVYNIDYSQHAFSLRSIYGTWRKLFLVPPLSYLSALSLGAAGGILTAVIPGRLQGGDRSGATGRQRGAESTLVTNAAELFFLSMLLAMVLEWGLVFVSGRFLGHYFITPLPAMTACAAYLFNQLPEYVAGLRSGEKAKSSLLLLIFGLTSMWGVEVAAKNLPTPAAIHSFIHEAFDPDYEKGAIVEYIQENAGLNDMIYIWEDHPEFYYLSDRDAPTGYLYASQLLLPDTNNDIRFHDLLDQLEASQPALILSQRISGAGIPFLGDSPEVICRDLTAQVCSGVLAIKQFVESEYAEAAGIGDWVIYSRLP